MIKYTFSIYHTQQHDIDLLILSSTFSYCTLASTASPIALQGYRNAVAGFSRSQARLLADLYDGFGGKFGNEVIITLIRSIAATALAMRLKIN